MKIRHRCLTTLIAGLVLSVFGSSMSFAAEQTLPVWDTLSTGCFSLTVSDNGNMGNRGIGGVNLDFFNFGDCDFVEEGATDTVPGDASVYLYDASPVICWPDGDSVICNYSMFGSDTDDGFAFLPLGDASITSETWGDVYHSSFTTRDGGLKIEQRLIAPHEGDTCEFYARILKIYVIDGQTHSGLAIGEAIDWNIPADSGVWNRSGFDNGRRLIYQQGSEITDSLGDAVECQENDLRFGGMALYAGLENYAPFYNFAGASTQANAVYIDPLRRFDNDSLHGLMSKAAGFATAGPVDADLFMLWTYRSNYTLGPEDTLEIFTYYVTSRDGETDFLNRADKAVVWMCDAFFCEPRCLTGDIDNSGSGPDISDLVRLVTFMFQSGPEPPCMEQANINGTGGYAPDIADLVYLVTFMFQHGPAPVPCTGCW